MGGLKKCLLVPYEPASTSSHALTRLLTHGQRATRVGRPWARAPESVRDVPADRFKIGQAQRVRKEMLIMALLDDACQLADEGT